MNFNHKTPIQLRFVDIDKLGHVNNANHLSYIELARTLYMQDVMGEDFQWDKRGIILARVEIDYKKIIRFEDEVYVLTRCSHIGTKSFDLSYRIIRMEKDGSETELASSLSVLVCIDYNHFKTIPIPEDWILKIKKFEGMNLSPSPLERGQALP